MRSGFTISAEMCGNGAPRVTKAAAQGQAGTGAYYGAAPGQPTVARNCNPPIATWSIATIAMSSTGFAASSPPRTNPTITDPYRSKQGGYRYWCDRNPRVPNRPDQKLD